MGPPGEEDVAPPLRPLEPRRETLVVTLSEPQWDSFRSCLSANIRRRFEKAGEFLTQIGNSGGGLGSLCAALGMCVWEGDVRGRAVSGEAKQL